MIVTSLRHHCIEGRLLGGDFDGKLRTILRVKLTSGEKDFTFVLMRKQFPVCLCFAMTINKSQWQSFERIGVDLRAPVFSHGQFYVAVSRVSSSGGVCVLLPRVVTIPVIYCGRRPYRISLEDGPLCSTY